MQYKHKKQLFLEILMFLNVKNSPDIMQELTIDAHCN